MNISSFKAGKAVQRYQYKSFEPNIVNIPWQINNAELVVLLSQANIKMGELNAFSQLIPDVDFFIKMHVLKEGTQSSRIEGTQTNIDEAIQKEEYIQPEKKDDWQEVQNYVHAMNQAIESLEKLPLSNRLLKETHKILLQGVRGTHKLPGEFRQSQNWIGGSSLVDATFIPPHQDSLADLMADLEKFLHNQNIPVPHLIKVGIAHYQFETIHPFLDGNGRIGRLLITLYLVSNNLLHKPTLYLSDFFERNKSLYYDNLTRVRTHNDLTQWLKYFLEGVRSTSENSIQTFKNIIKLRAEVEHKIISLGKKQALAKSFLQYLYGKPITDSNDVAEALNINVSTALRLIDDFIKLNILIEVTGYKRNRIFTFDNYIKLFR
ncbi:MAG: cell filamentation protein Fic [Bacteroidetes bacterium RIFCSPLOWO2_12_FULL_31_6]|nr:MAG: cell filamentation protein Fic [Bacteroidetes bacterium RIFCSPLOWO2_12_FULL_31_6]